MVCSNAPSYRKRCSRFAPAPLHDRVRIKDAKYNITAEHAGHSFTAIVVDAMGVPHQNVVAFLETIAACGVASGRLHQSQRGFFVRSSLTALAFAVLMGNLVLFQTCWPLAGAAAPPSPAPPAPVAAPVLEDISPPASPHVLPPVLAVAALAAAVPDSLDNSVVSDVIDALFSD